jgi:thiol-disulfide isomerase/thioredoxin
MLAAVLFSLLLAPGDRVTVYVFTTTDCPISNRYAPEIQRLAAKFGSSATFVLVYPVPADTPQVIADHKKKFAYTIGHVRDLGQKLVKLTGVTVTPEVAVVNGTQVLYRGRIDDRYLELGKDRPEPTRRDLEAALEAIAAGKAVAVPETRAVGCILADLLK